MKATGRSGLLPGAAAELTSLPVGEFYNNDLDASLRNLRLCVASPGIVPAGFGVHPPHDPAHALGADSLAVRRDQVSAALFPAHPVGAEFGVTVHNAVVVGHRARVLLEGRQGFVRNTAESALSF